jgi:peroxiredoxin
MKARLARGGVLAVLLGVLGLGLAARSAPLREGRPAPDFTGVTTDGKRLSLSQFRGKSAVLVNFYANFCPGCHEEFPHLKALDERYRDRGLQILAVNLDRTRREALVFPRRFGTQFPVIVDGDPIADRYDVRPIPASFLVDREGRLVRIIEGYRPEELDEAVRSLIR